MTDKEKNHSSTPTATLPTPTPTPTPIPVVIEPTKTLSGRKWCSQFHGSESLDDLAEPFRQNFYEFYVAMERAGCALNISSTYRPPSRAYLMHHSWLIVHAKFDAKKVPPWPGVDIEWDHGDAEKSKEAAAEMCATYKTNGPTIPPSLTSRHTEGFAVDMNITWTGDLSITQHDNTTLIIKTTPRNRMNCELHLVGAGYGIIKFNQDGSDPPHWSINGS